MDESPRDQMWIWIWRLEALWRVNRKRDDLYTLEMSIKIREDRDKPVLVLGRGCKFNEKRRSGE